ncbi:MAG: tRNA (adenosine(37)-N6)-threonylcarbamoyltransferase complex transferase subunit TsaD [Planctomycetota bacterium]|nr:MAG: tRNA (adenosine(37)-N6)-threonylcarbamoyltransferase complex transferase subunit TsaD [Planctomycetota bacterium]
MRILGIETSCDETAAAVVDDGVHVRSSIVQSQVELHSAFGGIVPEIASRAHTENITRVIDKALDDAGASLDSIDAVAVVNRPGLIGSLLVGVSAAKALALANDLPLIAVNHLHAHVYALGLDAEPITKPLIALVTSGGHTNLYLVRDDDDMNLIGRTHDDAAGEAFDKAAALLGLGFPGGPALSKAAEGGKTNAVVFKRAMLDRDTLDFSFSGLKTALLYHIKGQDKSRDADTLKDINVSDVAASFQEAVVTVLVRQTLRACKRTGIKTVGVGGGVAANKRLREKFEEEAKPLGIEVRFSRPEYSTDNAAMVAGFGHVLFEKGKLADPRVTAYARNDEELISLEN